MSLRLGMFLRCFLALAAIICILLILPACAGGPYPAPVSASGVSITHVKVPVGSDGLTAEQRNIRDRLVLDNTPGSIKHLYIISLESGDVLLYSTVRVKVTSSGKRLSPTTVGVTDGQYVSAGHMGVPVGIGQNTYFTGEVLQDDGTYGSSAEYIYWFDVRGAYHQQYVTGGMMLHVSDQPIAFPKIIVNLELIAEK
ncbi:MAG: hypothetical protein AAB776_00665 [Patescibacteria group bacterium]